MNTEILNIIHNVQNDNDYGIAIMKKENDVMKSKGGCRKENIEDVLGNIGDMENLYWTLNSFWVPEEKKPSGNLGTCWVERSNKKLRWMNALWIDIDAYKTPYARLSAETIIEIIGNEEDLPPWNIWTNSGRGIYLIWLLNINPNSERFVGDIEIYRWNSIKRKLCEILRKYGADSNGNAPSGILRFPESINTKSNSDVQYHIVDEFYRYTLEQLANQLGVVFEREVFKQTKRIQKSFPKKIVTDRKPKKGKSGFSQFSLQTARLKDLWKLNQLRNGIEEGKREQSLFLFSNCVHQIYRLTCKPIVQEDFYARLQRFNNQFRAPLPDYEVKKFITKRKEPYPHRNKTIIENLGISREEMEHMTNLIDKREKLSRRSRKRKQIRRNAKGQTKRQIVSENNYQTACDFFRSFPDASLRYLESLTGFCRAILGKYKKRWTIDSAKSDSVH